MQSYAEKTTPELGEELVPLVANIMPNSGTSLSADFSFSTCQYTPTHQVIVDISNKSNHSWGVL